MVESVLRAGTGLSATVLQLGTLETRALEVSTILHLSVHVRAIYPGPAIIHYTDIHHVM